MLKEISLLTKSQSEFIDITRKVQSFIGEKNIKSGIAVIFCPHTTAAITINENADPDVTKDMTYKLNKLIEKDDANYTHYKGNSHSHIKSTLTGPSLTVIISNGKLLLGKWQGIYFCEYDGARDRKFFIKIIED